MIMPEERSIPYVRSLSEIADSDRLVPFFQRQRDERLRQQVLRPFHSPVLYNHVIPLHAAGSLRASCMLSLIISLPSTGIRSLTLEVIMIYSISYEIQHIIKRRTK